MKNSANLHRTKKDGKIERKCCSTSLNEFNDTIISNGFEVVLEQLGIRTSIR